ncbi:FecR domain-containing protein, partial [bacterium]|nr:FecR domain-containing protein [bacterium]
MNLKSILLLLLFITFCTFAHADVIGKIIPLTGIPVIHSTPVIQVVSPSNINLKDRISTGKGITAKAVLNNGSTIVLKENTEMTFHKTFIKVKHGKSSFTMHKTGNKFKIYTPAVVIGIYGTDFEVDVLPSGDSEISLQTGKIKVTSIWGNKDSKFLKPGESIKGTKSGLSKIFKTELVLNTGIQSVNFTTEQSEIVPEEEIFDNLELSGDLCCYIRIFQNNRKRSLIENTWIIKVNGYDKYNGQQLSFSGGQKAFIKNLEPGYYDFTIILNGIEYTFPYELNRENSESIIKLLFENFRFKIYIGNMLKNLQYPEILKHLKIYVTAGGIKNQLYFPDNDKRNVK